MLYKLRPDFSDWNFSKITPATYICGYCGTKVSSDKGMYLKDKAMGDSYANNSKAFGVFICTSCNLPSFIAESEDGSMIQVPGINYGNSVLHLPDDVNEIYEEMRRCYSVSSYTGVISLGRILLDHIAVDWGAKSGQSFQQNVKYLKDNHYIAANSEKWVDLIRQYGNKSNHKLVINTQTDAQNIIKFCEMILKTNYEYQFIADNEI
ncbi:DUF4145 domain-containing protein [Companilactobacillus pabuli]|uniref:DUF4145 domain-containing protein n=1 Tax=Companilactobacillus pabuli TaxID=2714036 RepID=UPI002417AB22|nr:DUF4145 domain-containing protein [Companilactobacillus pabuli]MDG5113472.1 DUF4145 domain-containing protein [Companilactobacillus pabuli]